MIDEFPVPLVKGVRVKDSKLQVASHSLRITHHGFLLSALSFFIFLTRHHSPLP